MNTNSCTHACRVPDCGLEVPLRMLMCRSHWAMVPSRVQWQVLSAWRAWRAWQDGAITLAELRETQAVAAAAVVAVKGGVE